MPRIEATSLLEASKQALLALENPWESGPNGVASAITALRAVIEQMEKQEPFGYFRAEPFGWTDCAETDEGALALYTAPPAAQRQPLTDVQIMDAFCATPGIYQFVQAFAAGARFAEAAHGIR